MHFQKLQDRHKLCILDITLFAYDYLFEQQRNSHDEYLSEQKYFQPRGRHGHGLSSGAVQSRFGESLKGQIAWGKSPSESLGAFQQRILPNKKIFW